MAGSTESNKRMGEMVSKVSPTGCPKGYMEDENGDCQRINIDPGHDRYIDPNDKTFGNFGPGGIDPDHDIIIEGPDIDPHFNAGPPDIIKKTSSDQPMSFEEYMGIKGKERTTTTSRSKPTSNTSLTFKEFMAQKNKP